jgi:hypothetical protein
MSDPTQVVEQVAAEADATADQPMPPGSVFTRPSKSVTVAARVSPEDLAEVEGLAARLDVPPSSLIRGWILSGLNAHKNETVQSTIEKISADVQRLRELVADQTGPARTVSPALHHRRDASAGSCAHA